MAFFKSLVDKIRQGFDKGLEKTREAFIGGVQGLRNLLLGRALAPEWPTHRLAGVDRAILRLCHHELTSGANPAPIVLNEAVELARHFSTDRSPAFINALLDKIAKGAAKVGEGG